MRIVATSDTHFPFDNSLIPDGDLFIHAGDLMYTGYVDEWHSRVQSLAALPHKQKVLVPGNHDFHIDNYEGIAVAELRRQADVRVVGLKDYQFIYKNIRVLCLPYVTGLEGWAFNRSEEWLANFMLEEIGSQYFDGVVTHAPPYRILDAINPPNENVGCLAYNRWFHSLARKPKFWICGHIHESYGTKVIDGCTFANVSMCNREYKQVNSACVIDL